LNSFLNTSSRFPISSRCSVYCFVRDIKSSAWPHSLSNKWKFVDVLWCLVNISINSLMHFSMYRINANTWKNTSGSSVWMLHLLVCLLDIHGMFISMSIFSANDFTYITHSIVNNNNQYCLLLWRLSVYTRIINRY